MTRVLLFGIEPLPDDGAQTRLAAAGMRTGHVLNMIREAGHEVVLLTNRTYGTYSSSLPTVLEQHHRGFPHFSIDDIRWHDHIRLRRLVEQQQAGCAVAVSLSAGAAAARTVGNLPLWIDLYGDPLAEAQLKADVYCDDEHRLHYWQQFVTVLQRGDVYSTVSDRGRWSLVGALGTAGRLNHCTVSYPFVSVMPASAEAISFNRTPPPRTNKWRGRVVPADAFIILQTGGFNTWTDVEVLAAALLRIMAMYSRIYFIATGGTIPGHDDYTFQRFQTLIERSPHRDRFKLVGWLPTSDLAACYAECNVAVCVDRPCYEAQLGSRTRVGDWLSAGLPCIISTLPEFGSDLLTANGALSYSAGDAGTLIERLRWCVEHPQELRRVGERGRQFAHDHLTTNRLLQPLLNWIAAPTNAPDFQCRHQTLFEAHPAQSLYQQIWLTLRKRRLSLSLALRFWSIIAPITPSVLHRHLAHLGFRALRLKHLANRRD